MSIPVAVLQSGFCEGEIGDELESFNVGVPRRGDAIRMENMPGVGRHSHVGLQRVVYRQVSLATGGLAHSDDFPDPVVERSLHYRCHIEVRGAPYEAHQKQTLSRGDRQPRHGPGEAPGGDR